MRVSFKWTQTGRRGPRISRRTPVSQNLLAGLTLTASLAATAALAPLGTTAHAASFDETGDASGTTSVLLHEPGSVPLDSALDSAPDSEPADEAELFASDSAPAPAAAESVSAPLAAFGCTAGSDEPCGCPACRGDASFADSSSGGACSDRLCERRGPLADCDPQGLFQRLARHRKQSGICWTGRADALILFRNAPASRPLFDVNAASSIPALDADQLESGVAAGPRVSLWRRNPCGDAWEITYIYSGEFSSLRNLPAVTDGYLTAAPGIFGNDFPPVKSLNSASALLTGELQSAEINRRWTIGRNVQFLSGFRWLNWYESLAINDTFTGGQDFYTTDCTNNLYGGQIGLDALLWTHGPTGFRVESLVKAGAYANNASQTSDILQTDDLGVVYQNQITVARNPLTCSFAGEVGMTGVLPISRCWDFRCGYFGLWLASLAQPSGQLSGQNLIPPGDERTGSLVPNGLLVLQGVSLGLEGRW